MPATLKLICPNLSCRSILAVPDKARGHQVRCRRCGMRVMVPQRPPAVGTPAAPLADEEPSTGATPNRND